MPIQVINTVRGPGRPRVVAPVHTPPYLLVSDGTIEALKWFALVLMTLDHINEFLLVEPLFGLNESGRLAMPLFGFVLAYNLARPNALQRGSYERAMVRLALFGMFATPFYIALGAPSAGWWPLNILFTLLVATAIIYYAEKGRTVHTVTATVLFLIGGAIVDYWWFGLAFCLAAWWYCKTASGLALVAWIAATASLYLVNDNLWAMAALPLVFVASRVQLRIPRLRLAFYTYYPAHLALLLALS